MKIKNCPFCGSEVELKKVPLWKGSHGYYGCYEYIISCDNCGCNKHLGNNNTVYYTDEEAKQNAIDNWNMRVKGEWIVPPVTPAMPACEDAVSRKAAIMAMQELEQRDIEAYGCKIPEGYDATDAIKALMDLPSVTPAREKGEWIVHQYDLGYIECVEYLECEKCHSIFLHEHLVRNSFCPNCGADMREGDEG